MFSNNVSQWLGINPGLEITQHNLNFLKQDV